jgi:hypothetical protein
MTKEKLAHQETLAFEAWMRDTIKTVYYADAEGMNNAYDRVFNNDLELSTYANINR